MRVSRREVIAGAGAAVGATATSTSGCAPEPGDSAETATAPVASIDHVIVVMMENRSFDHFLGALTLAEGRTDVDGLTTSMSNPDGEGTPVVPYPNEIPCVGDPGHSWGNSHDQFNDGANDHFVTNYGGPEVMQYMQRADLPIYYALADNFTVCDKYFCSVMGPTWPNRFYGHCGTSLGMTSNDFPPDGSYVIPNVWEQLTAKGVAWGYYFTDLPFVFLIDGVYQPDSPRFIEDFVADCEAGTLPAVCWVDPAFGFNDDHPPHHVAMGQEFVAAIYKALSTSPLWDKCLLIITYDEHGGFHDHVPPPKTDDDYVADGFDQLGFRVPVLTVGPWVKQGVCNTTFDHTSWQKFICDKYEIEPWTKRIAAANSIAEVLDQDRMDRYEPLPPVELPAFDYEDESLPNECTLGGIFGPPPPAPAKRSMPSIPKTFPALPEVWQHLFAAAYPEDTRVPDGPRIAQWIRDYVRGQPTFRFRR